MVLNMKINKNILLGMVIGAVCYFALFDIKTLDPSYIEWYIQKGDRGQHILGFLAYINSSFYFPYSLTDFIFYPEKISRHHSCHMDKRLTKPSSRWIFPRRFHRIWHVWKPPKPLTSHRKAP